MSCDRGISGTGPADQYLNRLDEGNSIFGYRRSPALHFDADGHAWQFFIDHFFDGTHIAITAAPAPARQWMGSV